MQKPLQLGLWVAALMLAADHASAAGWNQREGASYFKLTNRTLVGDGIIRTDGEVEDLPAKFQDHLVSFYLEHGLTRDLTLVVSGSPFGYTRYDGRSTVYAGPFFGGLRHPLTSKFIHTAVEAHVGFRPPASDDVWASGRLASGPTFVYRPMVASAFADIELQAGMKHPLGWASLTAGARYFSNDALRPAAYGNLQLGFETTFGLVADLHANFLHHIGEIDVENVLGTGQTRYLGIGATLSYWFTRRFALTASFEGVAYAKANAASPSLVFGIELR